MHKSFLPLFIFSLIGVLCTSFLPRNQTTSQWIGLIAGLLPLCIYHVQLSRQKILSPGVIDSIYYFGFLVTVITLVSTAISIAIDTKAPNMQWILLQFGLGLIATGYSLFARLMLMNRSSSNVELDVVESSQELVKSVTRLSGEFDRAGHHATAFADLFEERLNNLLEKSLETYTKSIETTTHRTLERCSISIDDATNKFSGAISIILEEVERIQDEAEAISFKLAAERLQNFSDGIESSLNHIIAKVNEASSSSAASISELSTTTRKVQKLATDIAAKLEKLNQLQAMLDTLSNTSEALDVFNNSIISSSSSLANLSSISAEASTQLDVQIITPLTHSSMLNGLTKLTEVFPNNAANLATTVSDLNNQAAELTKTIANYKTILDASVVSTGTTADISENLKYLDQTIKSASISLANLQGTIEVVNTNLASVKIENNLNERSGILVTNKLA